MRRQFLTLLMLFLIGCSDNKTMEKHPLDKSKERKIILENGLKVYLLSDPNFNMSSASMSVMVGSLEDPNDRQGLAHFLEHMLFLGTKKYPDVDEYGTYLKTNGGYSNAYTARDHTNYHFQVLPDGFEGAIDRFSQFFIEPLFTEKYTQREVNAVDSEHKNYLMNDFWRSFQVSNLFVKDNHPARNFNVGNLETLGDIKREELIDFYKKHYSSNRMALSLLSKHSLDQMETWAKKYFTDVENKNLAQNKYDSKVFEKKKTIRTVQIEPVKDIRRMTLSYFVPGVRLQYLQKPSRQLGFILGHQGEGSLLSYLKNKGWATSLYAGIRSETKEYDYAQIRIELTKKGLEEYQKIIGVTYSYIELMKKSGFQKHVFDELKTMANLDEVYSNKGEGAGRAENIANELNMYNFKDAGRINYAYGEPKAESFDSLLSYFTLENMLVLLSAKGLETENEEYYYKAKYSYFENDSLYLSLLKNESTYAFELPKPNSFIPRKVKIPNREINKESKPRLLINNKNTKIYFGKDHEFLRPKGVISYKVLFPKNKINAKHRAFLKIYIECVRESMNEVGFPARLAGLSYSLFDGYEGIYLTVIGYTESAIKLYTIMLNNMKNIEISNEKFLAIKDKIIRGYENIPLSDAYQQAREKNAEIYHNVKFNWDELAPIAEAATMKNIKDYGESLFSEIAVEGFIYGDFEEKDARKTLRLFKEKTGYKGISRSDAFELKFLNQKNPEIVQYVDSLKVNNSCFWREYQVGLDTPELRAKSIVIGKAIQQPFYTEMRTNQQLGYIVWSNVFNRDDLYFLSFAIQSGAYPADELNTRADKYISSLPEYIKSMDSTTFNQIVESSIEELEKSPKSISERGNKLKNLVFEFEADFDRDKKTIAALRQIKKQEVLNLMEETVGKEKRKMVNTLVFANEHQNKKKLESSFKDVKLWKANRTYR